MIISLDFGELQDDPKSQWFGAASLLVMREGDQLIKGFTVMIFELKKKSKLNSLVKLALINMLQI